MSWPGAMSARFIGRRLWRLINLWRPVLRISCCIFCCSCNFVRAELYVERNANGTRPLSLVTEGLDQRIQHLGVVREVLRMDRV